MSTVEEIETEIKQLPADAQWELVQRLNSRLWKAWDRQIDADAKAGRLDHLLTEVESDIATDRVKPLDEVIDNP